MNILIFTKKDNIQEIYNYIITKVIPEEYSRFNNNEAVVLSGDLEIRIKKYNPSASGFRGRIVLYDGDFTQEEIDVILLPMLHDIRLSLDGERLNEMLLAPIGNLKYLLHNDIIYMVTGGERDYINVQLITKDLIKALTKMNDGHYHEIRAYKEDSDEEIFYYTNEDFNNYEFKLLKDAKDVLKHNITLE
jgi:hypothetical protein